MKLVFAILLLAAPLARAQIYADVSVRHGETDLGQFTIELFYGKAPRTVANFIRLAQGSAPWVDEATGLVQYGRPFYDGITFHRVISGFMSQTGSPNGQGTDGPGYMFPDEVDNGLVFDAVYQVAMANSGPNTNGSQFFITAAATDWLNGKHTIFGKITAGKAVCDAINSVETGPGDKPLVPVVIESVAIRKVGLGQSFDENAQGVPMISEASFFMRHDAEGTALIFNQSARSLARVRHSSDLHSWKNAERYLDFEASPAAFWNVDAVVGGDARHFFTEPATMVNYPEDAVFPDSMAGRTLTTTITGSETITFHFNSEGGGTYEHNGGAPGTITSYQYTPDGYGGWLLVFTDGLVPLRYRLGYDSSTPQLLNGRFSGTAYATDPFSIDGTFTLTR